MKKHTTRLLVLSTLLLVVPSVRAHTQHACHAAFSVHQLANSFTIDFTDASSGPDAINAWLWEFGDGNTSTEQSPSHTYVLSGIYLVCLNITDAEGCSSHVCHQITVHEPVSVCHAAFLAHQIEPDQPTIDFTDQSSSHGHIISWEWDFGDGSISGEQSPSHTYMHSGVYLVCLIITDDEGCTSHVCHHVTVHHPAVSVCHAAFLAHQPDPDQPTIDFTDVSTSDSDIISWEWDFGDGSTSGEQNPSHTYVQSGVYLVCLIITDADGCTSHECHQITVDEPLSGCHAAFLAHQIDPDQPTIDFTDQSTSHGDIISWEWDFGDGQSSNEQNPSHTYVHQGVYLVCLIITDDEGCTSHVCHHLTVHHSPTDVNNVEHEMAVNDSNQDINSAIPTHHRYFSFARNPSFDAMTGSDIVALNNPEYIVCFPNPFSSSTTIQYALTDNADVKIEIYDMLGTRIYESVNEKRTKGVHAQVFNADDLNTGYYLVRIIVNREVNTKRISVVR